MIEPARTQTAPAKRCPTCGLRFEGGTEVTCPKDGAALEDAIGDPFVGTVLAGTYRVTRMMAAGGMGRVYEAIHVRLERKLVVKVMLESHAFKPDILARAEREAQAISRIRSEHVVDVVDVLRTPDGRPCLVVDFLEGEDLGARLARVGKMSVVEAVSITRQICSGMRVAHAAGVVHRDLKPSNVFLVARPGGDIAKVLDFGVAKLEGGEGEGLTQTGALVGTPAYMAPEQALNAGRVDARTDVYAIAAILYHMLTGVAPYSMDDPTVALMDLLKGEPPRASSVERSIPEDLEAVIERAMARDPLHRTQTVERLAEELEPYGPLPTRSSTAPPPMLPHGPSRPSAPSSSSRWTRSTVVALTAAAILACTAWAAAFSAAVLFAAIEPRAPTDIQRLIVPISAAAVFLAVAALGFRALILRWRSHPRIESHRRALAHALAGAFIVAAAVELAALARRAAAMTESAPPDSEHAVALGLAAFTGLAVFLISRWRG
jgi:serine/threonine-protein kinase